MRAVILTGAGPAFCAGMDLGEMLETSRQDDAHAQWHRDAVVYLDLLLMMLRSSQAVDRCGQWSCDGRRSGAGDGVRPGRGGRERRPSVCPSRYVASWPAWSAPRCCIFRARRRPRPRAAATARPRHCRPPKPCGSGCFTKSFTPIISGQARPASWPPQCARKRRRGPATFKTAVERKRDRRAAHHVADCRAPPHQRHLAHHRSRGRRPGGIPGKTRPGFGRKEVDESTYIRDAKG